MSTLDETRVAEIRIIEHENADLITKIKSHRAEIAELRSAMSALVVAVGRIDHNLPTEPDLWAAWRAADKILDAKEWELTRIRG